MASRALERELADAPRAAPEWQASEWLNTEASLTFGALRGLVVALHAFRMLSPGCALHAVSQAERVHRMVARDDVAVVGLPDDFVVVTANMRIVTERCVGRLRQARVGHGVPPV